MSEIVERIKAGYERDINRNVVATSADQLPNSYDEISGEWLNAVLCAQTPGAEVQRFELGPVDTGSSNRRKIAVEYNQAGQDAGLPEKLFCKATHDLLNRIVLGTSGGLECEVVFYNDLLKATPIETPVCYYANYDPETFNSMIILGDLSDDVESFCDHHTPINRARIESQLEVLSQFHGFFQQDKGKNPLLAKLPTWPEYFARTLRMGMKEGSNQGFLAAEEVIPPSLYKQYDKIWPATQAAVDRHNELPLTLSHGDVHLKNWYVLPNDKMGLGDWQCCSAGHWGRDLAYAITTALTIDKRRLWERELVQNYLELMAEKGATVPAFDEAFDIYRQQLLSALTWWTITLTPSEGMPDMQPRDITLDFIQRLSTAIDDLDSLSCNP